MSDLSVLQTLLLERKVSFEDRWDSTHGTFELDIPVGGFTGGNIPTVSNIGECKVRLYFTPKQQLFQIGVLR